MDRDLHPIAVLAIIAVSIWLIKTVLENKGRPNGNWGI